MFEPEPTYKDGKLVYHPEIEKYLKSLRKERRGPGQRARVTKALAIDGETSSHKSSEDEGSIKSVHDILEEDNQEEKIMGDRIAERTLKEIMFLGNANLNPAGVVLPAIQNDWELKHSLIQILPKFSDHPGEEPQRHLQDFEMAIRTIRTTENQGTLREYIRLLTFPFFLQDGAREWLYQLPNGSVTTWQQLQAKFLERYYPFARIQSRDQEHQNGQW